MCVYMCAGSTGVRLVCLGSVGVDLGPFGIDLGNESLGSFGALLSL